MLLCDTAQRLNWLSMADGATVLSTRRLEQILLPIGDLQTAVFIKLTDVTSGKPAIGKAGLPSVASGRLRYPRITAGYARGSRHRQRSSPQYQAVAP